MFRCWVGLILLLTVANGAYTDQPDVIPNIKSSADFIVKCQLDNGLIAMGTETDVWAVPYFANISGISLLRAYQVTKDKSYLNAVLKYIDWYSKNINTDGTIYDYGGTRSKPEPKGTYDSTDSYAATYIWLCYETYAITKDKSWLKKTYPTIIKCVSAIMLTWQPDGLTYATPKYPVKYLMDNLEVRIGLRCAVQIANILKDKKNSGVWKQKLAQNLNGIRKLWIDKDNRFAYALHQDGTVNGSLSVWYPDGMANAMAAIYLLNPKDTKATRLVNELTDKFPDSLDYWKFACACKFGLQDQARKARLHIQSNLNNALDHAHYIRTLTPKYDHFAYSGEFLNLPKLAKPAK